MARGIVDGQWVLIKAEQRSRQPWVPRRCLGQPGRVLRRHSTKRIRVQSLVAEGALYTFIAAADQLEHYTPTEEDLYRWSLAELTR